MTQLINTFWGLFRALRAEKKHPNKDGMWMLAQKIWTESVLPVLISAATPVQSRRVWHWLPAFAVAAPTITLMTTESGIAVGVVTFWSAAYVFTLNSLRIGMRGRQVALLQDQRNLEALMEGTSIGWNLMQLSWATDRDTWIQGVRRLANDLHPSLETRTAQLIAMVENDLLNDEQRADASRALANNQLAAIMLEQDDDASHRATAVNDLDGEQLSYDEVKALFNDNLADPRSGDDARREEVQHPKADEVNSMFDEIVEMLKNELEEE